MYSPRLYKYRDSYVLYIPTVHAFGSVFLTHTFWYRHTHMTFLPPDYIWSKDLSLKGVFTKRQNPFITSPS